MGQRIASCGKLLSQWRFGRESCSIVRSCLLTVFLVACFFHQSQGAANVTLRSITIFRQHNWFFSPKVFFSCAGQYGNRTNLPFVKSTLHWYPATGLEPWQPLLTLREHECATCGVFQYMWFENSVFGRWTICTHNFTALDDSEALLTLMVNGSVAIDVACPDCPNEDRNWHSQHPEGSDTTVSTSLSIFFWVFAMAASLGLAMFFISIIAYINKDSGQVIDEERTKFLEVSRLDSRSETDTSDETGRRDDDNDDSETKAVIDKAPQEKPHVSNILRDTPDEFV